MTNQDAGDRERAARTRYIKAHRRFRFVCMLQTPDQEDPEIRRALDEAAREYEAAVPSSDSGG